VMLKGLKHQPTQDIWYLVLKIFRWSKLNNDFESGFWHGRHCAGS
jgi:hypothetical protein